MTADDPDTETNGPEETETQTPTSTQTESDHPDEDAPQQSTRESPSRTADTADSTPTDIAETASETEATFDSQREDESAEWTEEIPQETVEEARRLTRLAKDASDPTEVTTYQQQRDQLISEYGFDARVRERDDMLVCYPDEWIESGTVQLGQVTDRDRAIEIPLSGSGDSGEWSVVEAHNAALVAQIRTEHGQIHAANARALADFMGNHHAQRIHTATPEQLEEFRTEYYERNVWPTDDQRELLERTLQIVDETAKK